MVAPRAGWAVVLLGFAPLAAFFVHCSSFSAAPEPTTDAAPLDDASGIDAPTTGDDGAVPDGACQAPAAPTGACFTTGGCESLEIVLEEAGNDSSITLVYPHDVTLWKEHVYFVVQENTTEGRNRNGAGSIYRVDAKTLGNLQRITGLLEAPAALTVQGGFLYWRTVATGVKSRIERIDLAKVTPTLCGPGTCGHELVAEVQGAKVEQIFVTSPSEVYYRFGLGQLWRVRKDERWGVPAGPIGPGDGLLGGGYWTVRGPLSTRMYTLSAPEGIAHVSTWQDAGASLMASACSDAFLYDSDSQPSLYRVLFADAGTDGGLLPIACSNGCEKRRVYAHSVDARFAYVGSVDSGHLRAVPLAGGDAVTLATGDVWDVVNDDDAVYFSDVNGHRIRRISKR